MIPAPDMHRSAQFRFLPVLPQALDRVRGLLAAPTYDESAVVEIISKDPSLLLQVVETTAGRPAQETSIPALLNHSVQSLGPSGLNLLIAGILSRIT